MNIRKWKLPFTIQLARKYNEINIYRFLSEWQEAKDKRKIRRIVMENDLHMELQKFETYGVSIHQITDLAIRYALSKREFAKISSMLIFDKERRNG